MASTIVGAEMVSQLGWLQGDEWLANYMDAIGALFQQTAAIVMDVGSPGDHDYQTGYGTVFTVNPRFAGDTAICPTAQLPYLGQFVGVNIAPGADDATARSLITSEQGMQRGTPAAIVAAAKRSLAGTQSVVNVQRTRPDGVPSAFWFVLIVRPEEVIDAAALVAAVDAVTPAGLMWVLAQNDGTIWDSDSREWQSNSNPWGTSASSGGPTNTEPPTITGTPVVGDTLTAATGTWTGTGITYTYQWAQIGGANIAGATASTYVLQSSDAGHQLYVAVTGTNSGGATTADSAQTPTVTAAGGPTNTALPTISGTAQVGDTLTATSGTWTGSGITYAYQWNQAGGATISGATSTTYQVKSSDVGYKLYVTVTAADSGGSTSANSADTAAITSGSSGSYTVNAAPTGPAAPSDGWKCVAADAFNSSYPLSALWYPNRNSSNGAANQDQSGFNGNEVEVFNDSQVSITAQGVELTAVCINPAKQSNAYRSGCITTQTNGQANPFHWKPTVGCIVTIEAVIKMPELNGSDLGWWTDVFFNLTSGGSGGKQEIDFFEQFNYNNNGGGGEISVGAFFGTNASGASFDASREYYPKDNGGVDIAHDGKFHRWTHEFDGTASTPTLRIYLDGVLMANLEDPNNGYKVGPGSYPWPTGWETDVWEVLLLSYALRDITPGSNAVPPPYTVGTTDTAIMQSVAVYVNGDADTSSCIQGGFIAPGTTVA